MLACIVGHSSLYVVFRGAPDPIIDVTSGTDGDLPHRVHRIEVAFDGEDLGRLPVSRDELLSRIGGIRLTARYLGFRAGWAYLEGWPAEWAVPRRATSRPVARGRRVRATVAVNMARQEADHKGGNTSLYAFPTTCEQTLRALSRYPSRTAFSWPGGSLSYQGAIDLIGRMQGVFTRLALTPGSRMALAFRAAMCSR